MNTSAIRLPQARHRVGAGLVGLLRCWRRRAGQRARLAQLDEHLLRDIGLDRHAALREASKPFWAA